MFNFRIYNRADPTSCDSDRIRRFSNFEIFSDRNPSNTNEALSEKTPLSLWIPKLLNFMALWPFHSASGRLSKRWLLYSLLVCLIILGADISAFLSISKKKLEELSFATLSIYFLYFLFSFHFFSMFVATMLSRSEYANHFQLIHLILRCDDDNNLLGKGTVRRRVQFHDRMFATLSSLFIVGSLLSIPTMILMRDWNNNDPIIESIASLFFIDNPSAITMPDKIRMSVCVSIWIIQCLATPIFSMTVVCLCRTVAKLFSDVNRALDLVLFSLPDKGSRYLDIFSLLRLHTHLSDLVDNASKAFGLCLALAFFNAVVANLFFTVFFIRYSVNASPDTFVILIGFIVNINLMMFFICYYPSRIWEEAHDCSLPLHKFLLINRPSQEETNLVRKFLDRIGNEKVALHVNYYFYVDRKALLTMYSIFVSYIIILQQFASSSAS